MNGEEAVGAKEGEEFSQKESTIGEKAVTTEKTDANSAKEYVNTEGTAIKKRGRKRSRPDSTEGETVKKRGRKHSRPDSTEGESVTEKTKKKRGRKGPKLFTGLLTSPAGLKWVTEFEENSKKQSVTRSIVTISSQQGPITLNDCDVEAEMEVADDEDYYTVLKEDADAVIEPPFYY